MEITYYKLNKADLKVEDISLLTLEEVEQLPGSIRFYACSWWLRSAGYTSHHAAWVNHDGSTFGLGEPVNYDFCAVRPTLTISNLESLNLKIGDVLTIKGEEYRYIGGNKALYNDEVVCHRFDEESNNYEQSDIKKIVDKWFEERV